MQHKKEEHKEVSNSLNGAVQENTECEKNVSAIKTKLDIAKNKITPDHNKKLLKDLIAKEDKYQISVIEALIGIIKNSEKPSKDLIHV